MSETPKHEGGIFNQQIDPITGRTSHDRYYEKDIKKRGKPREYASGEIELMSQDEIQEAIDSRSVYSSLLRWSRDLEKKTTGANIHDMAGARNAFYGVEDILKRDNFPANATFGDLKEGGQDNLELYEVIVESLQRAQKILPGFSI